MSIDITVAGGSKTRLLTAGKYCADDIVVTATGGGATPPTPDDGKTRVYIHLEYGRTSPMMGVCPKGTVTVDWGDGTEPDILTGTSTTSVKWTPTHNYAAPGDYVITLTVDGEMGFYGAVSTNENSGILRYSSGISARNRVYQAAVHKVEIGDGVTSIDSYAFSFCQSLASVFIPEGVTSIGHEAFGYCHPLASVFIPESVTSISSYAFLYCYGVRYYDFTACTSVPTLSDTNAFSNITADCEMLIPAALYDEWSKATNWATYAKYMVAV